MSAKEILGGKSHGLGTQIAEYAETGPYHCEDCVLQKPLNAKQGLCHEPHVLQDAQHGRLKMRKALALVNLEHGCCRFVKPPAKQPPIKGKK